MSTKQHWAAGNSKAKQLSRKRKLYILFIQFHCWLHGHVFKLLFHNVRKSSSDVPVLNLGLSSSFSTERQVAASRETMMGLKTEKSPICSWISVIFPLSLSTKPEWFLHLLKSNQEFSFWWGCLIFSESSGFSYAQLCFGNFPRNYILREGFTEQKGFL